MSWYGTEWLFGKRPRTLSEAEVQALQRPSTGQLLLMAGMAGLAPDFSRPLPDEDVPKFIELRGPDD